MVQQMRVPDQQSEKVLQTLMSIIVNLPSATTFYKNNDFNDLLLAVPEICQVGQLLVDFIKRYIQCHEVVLYGLKPEDDHLYFIAASGLNEEQMPAQRLISGKFTLSDCLDPGTEMLLRTDEIVITERDKIHPPLEIRHRFGNQYQLLHPLFANNALVGVIVVGREREDGNFTASEITLVRAIAILIILVLGRASLLYEWNKAQSRQEAAEISNQRINKFLEQVSHELKTPLTSILGNLQLASRRLNTFKEHTQNPEEIRLLNRLNNPIEAAMESAEVQQNLINHMIDDSQIQSGTFILHMKESRLMDIVQEAIRLEHDDDHSMILTGEIKTYYIIADTERILQVLRLFINNALHYSPLEQPVMIDIQDEQKHVRVSIIEKGSIGIKPSEQPHIWERFYRTSGASIQNELEIGMGLGLYICRHIIEMHHGEVGLTSNPGQYTTFWFKLPLAPTRQKS